jgi:glycosyltransferase involved in cell wall biosynthesis
MASNRRSILTTSSQATVADIAVARHHYRLPETFILTVAARRPHQNHEVLLRALPDIPEPIGLVIVGASDPLPSLIKELNLESRVHLIPEVAEQDLPAVYQAASVFAFPSPVEGYGAPVLEAMAAGVPVVTSVPEVTGPAAIKVPPHYAPGWAWALTAVLTNLALAAHLKEAGRTTLLTETRPLTLVA